MAEDQAYEGGFKLYRYDPSLAGNIVFVVLFALATIGHVVFLVRKRTWYFIPFVIACLFETVGYIGRAIAAQEAPDFSLNVYIIQTLLILLGPALLAASIYMILGRLIRMLGAEEYALIRTNWMTKVFVTGDVLSFLAQGAGGGLLAQAKTHDDQKRGEAIILGGLGIQVAFFGFFIVTTVVFHRRMAAQPTARSYSVTGPWRALITALYASSALVMVRSVFRMVEFGMGNDSILMSSEGYLLGLDGALMFIVVVIFLWSHPSRALAGYKESLASSTESGRNTAESFQMLAVHPEGAPPLGTLAPGKYDSDSTAVGGQQGYAYDAPPARRGHGGDHRYSSSYGR
ncbi:RTA1 like protein-domain-containing protein [Parachaetomium inaequale]|uniref:RTA1 like protein-domain-containing protein n=1 Tax=Parachaetomium inaequale TaxID=2588326 RepID=A0AAN6P8B3_9PEZI|nr:RTA1 like protein-domain-containing protein [Parachaetomium inaequale]